MVNAEALQKFVVVGLHTAPDDTPHELRELDNVAKEIRDVSDLWLKVSLIVGLSFRLLVPSRDSLQSAR